MFQRSVLRPVPTLVLAFLLLTVSAWADTEVSFVADGQTPVFRITALLVEPSGFTLSSDVTEVLKKMELLTLAPSTIRVPDGDYLLNWGGTEDFNRTFTLKAEGTPRVVRLLGSPTAALWSLGAAGTGSLAALVTGPWAARDPALLPWAAGAASVAVGGLLSLWLFAPRVEVQ